MQLQQVARCPLPAARCQLQVARVKSIHIRTADSCRLSIAAAAASVVVSGRLAEWDFDFAEREQTEIDRACPRLTPRVWVAHQMHLSVGLLNLRPNKTDCQGFRFFGLHLRLPLWLRFWFWVCLYPLPLQSDRFQGPPWSQRQRDRLRDSAGGKYECNSSCSWRLLKIVISKTKFTLSKKRKRWQERVE